MDKTLTGASLRRPLWRRIIDFPPVAVLLAIAMFAATLATARLIEGILPSMGKQLEVAVEATILIALLIGVHKLGMARLGSQPRDDLPLKGAARGISVGVLFGLVLFSAVVGIAALTGVYRIVGIGDTSRLVIALFTLAIMPGFIEELLFRGILFRWIEDFGGSWAALLVTSLLFGAGHIFNPNASLLSSFAIAVEAGILLGGAYMLTRNLWMAMGLHASWNFTQGEIYDVPVSGTDQTGLVTAQLSGPELLSGGAFGLEASIIAMVLATAAGITLVVMAVRAGHIVQPWWVRRRLERLEEAVRIDVDRDADLGAPLDLGQPRADNVLHV